MSRQSSRRGGASYLVLVLVALSMEAFGADEHEAAVEESGSASANTNLRARDLQTNYYYPKWGNSYGDGTCPNDGNEPTWFTTNGYLFTSLTDCCDRWFPNQNGNACLGPQSATTAVTYYYPKWGSDYDKGTCPNDGQHAGWMQKPYYLFDDLVDCCERWFPNQNGDLCTGAGANGTSATTSIYFYPKWGNTYADGECLNDGNEAGWMSEPYYLFASNDDCCETWFPNQNGDKCLGTSAISAALSSIYFYPRWGNTYADGVCINDGQEPNWMAEPFYLFTSRNTCCSRWFPNQNGDACLNLAALSVRVEFEASFVACDLNVSPSTSATDLAAVVAALKVAIAAEMGLGSIATVTILTVGGVDVGMHNRRLRRRRLVEVVERALNTCQTVTFAVTAERTCTTPECSNGATILEVGTTALETAVSSGSIGSGTGEVATQPASYSTTSSTITNIVISQEPSAAPTTSAPTNLFFPSFSPSVSSAPSDVPSDQPSAVPSKAPSDSPSDVPSDQPSSIPSDVPSSQPSNAPSISVPPSGAPSASPSVSDVPSSAPSLMPSISKVPSVAPSDLPSVSDVPSSAPSDQPSVSSVPSGAPSAVPSISEVPSAVPSGSPSVSAVPSSAPSLLPSISLKPSSNNRTAVPSDVPSVSQVPSGAPSGQPSVSDVPSDAPSAVPSISEIPSAMPSGSPSVSAVPSSAPSDQPSLSQNPSDAPSGQPSVSAVPSSAPSDSPSLSQSPSNRPSDVPSNVPSSEPSRVRRPIGDPAITLTSAEIQVALNKYNALQSDSQTITSALVTEINSVTSSYTIYRQLAFVAHTIWESAGYQYTEEQAAVISPFTTQGDYQTCDWGTNEQASNGLYYYGRGYIQLSWCANYKAYGAARPVGGDADYFYNNPDEVATATYAMDSADWYFEAAVTDATGQFGLTTNAINGPNECISANNVVGSVPQKRWQIFEALAIEVGLTGYSENGCYVADTESPSLSAVPSSMPSQLPSVSLVPSGNPSQEPSVSEQPSPSPTSMFHITTMNMGSNTLYDDDFAWAAARWEEVITNDLSDRSSTYAATVGITDWFLGAFTSGAYTGAIDDVVIGYEFKYIDGLLGTLASAGPRYFRNDNTPISGVMSFDEDDFAAKSSTDARIIILHEMGHVLGLVGTLGDCNSGCENSGTNYTYQCPLAAAEYTALFGGTLLLENDGGGGTACGHWDEDMFNDTALEWSELMTGYFEANKYQPLSRVSVAGLDDIAGYEVNYDMADAYGGDDALRNRRRLSHSSFPVLKAESTFHLVEDPVTGNTLIVPGP